MSTGDLLRIEPQELQFSLELRKLISCSFRLSNETDNYVAFKVMSTNKKEYCVRPCTGIVLPRSTCDVNVTMDALKEAPPDMQSKDKFLVRSVTVSPGAVANDITPEMFNEEPGRNVKECKVMVVFEAPPRPPSRVREGSSPGASISVSRNTNNLEFTARKVSHSPPISPCDSTMSTGNLLRIEPQELQFPFELRKQISCSIQLSNKTDSYVAFKVKTTNPKKYCVGLNHGIVLPRSTFDVIVTMQAQEAAPLDMNCMDKFLLQSATASPGATAKDITREMFIEDWGRKVEECKMRVVYVAPPRPSSRVREGSPARGSISGSRNLNNLEFAASKVPRWPLISPCDSAMRIGDLLRIEPQVLQFPFELRKLISCSLRLSNETNNYVAFEVTTTNPTKYLVRPNPGIVLPSSTCDVKVTMQAQKEAPLDMDCKDRLLLQSATASPGVTAKDITREMFNDEPGRNVKECKLRVVSVAPPPPLSLVRRGFAPPASVPAIRSSNYLEFTAVSARYILTSIVIYNKT